MKKLIYYKSLAVNAKSNFRLTSIQKFSHFFKLFNNDQIIDRTGVLKFPVMTENLFPIPKFRVFEKTYEEICNQRAIELLKKSDEIGGDTYIFYSGGIDSTLVLISFLKNASELQKQKIIVLMSEESIIENPNFYKNFIDGKLKTASSFDFPHLLGSNNLLVTGEHNDQLFGSVLGKDFIEMFGKQVLHENYDRSKILALLNSIVFDDKLNNFYLDLFEKLINAAPIKIKTNFEFLWWIYFSLKWQAVFMNIPIYTKKVNYSKITKQYLENNYCTFFNTEDFQLWSMNNMDKRVKEDWKSYKWVCKDIIYSFNKDEDYRDNKIKIGSLGKVRLGFESVYFIDSDLNFYKDLPIEEYYNPDNDFI